MLSRIAPKNINMTMTILGMMGMVRASLIGPGLTIPFRNHSLLLGTWQQIVLLEMDMKPRQLSILIQIMGEQE